jgi:glycerol-3-phosphate dehydrogenase
MRPLIIGAGAFGTAVSVYLAKNGHNPVIWAYEREVADSINHERENFKFLPGVKIPETVTAFSEISKTADLFSKDSVLESILIAVPMEFYGTVIERFVKNSGIDPLALSEKLYITLSKGIDRRSGLLPFQMLSKILLEAREQGIRSKKKDTTAGIRLSEKNQTFPLKIFAAAGPNIAANLATMDPAGITFAGGMIGKKEDHLNFSVLRNKNLEEQIKKLFSSNQLALEFSDRIVYLQISSVMKNIAAIISGAIAGSFPSPS